MATKRKNKANVETCVSYEDDKKALIKIIKELGYKFGIYNVFNDFLVITTVAISNIVDKLHFDKREKLYMDTIKKYSKDELEMFVKMNSLLIMALNKGSYKKDLLGEIYHELNLHNEFNGQFFSPMHICELMANITYEDAKDKEYQTVCEPTCGSGAMIIALGGIISEKGGNPATQMCALAVDNDIRCVMMAYIQLSYLGIPAVVVHGDSLLVKEYERFYTPIYIVNGWLFKETMSMENGLCEDDEKLKCMYEPSYAMLKYAFKSDKREDNANG